MKTFFLRAMLCATLFAAASGVHLHAQAAPAGPVDAKVCEILKDPTGFDGKTVRIQGTVVSGLDVFQIEDPGENCGLRVNAIWLTYPHGTNAISGPVVMLQLQAAKNFAGTVTPLKREPVKLEKNHDWKQFDELLAQPYKGHGLCLGCARNTVKATLVGRIDAVRSAVLLRNADGKVTSLGGFGNLNAYPVRLVLESVSNVVEQPIDFSKINDAVHGDSVVQTDQTDPGAPRGSLGDAGGAAKTFSKDGPNGKLIQRAVDAFGDKDNYIGIEIYGGNYDEENVFEGMSRHSSPDGLIYNCSLDAHRLEGIAMGYAMVHLGSHIADIRGPQPPTGPATLFVTESNAWLTDAFYALGKARQDLVMPGGYVLWNQSWPTPERSAQINRALLIYLVKSELHP